MKQTGVLLACLTMYCGLSNAASDAIFSLEKNKVSVPYVSYQGKLYQMDMTFEAPNLLTMGEMKERKGGMMPAPGMIVQFADNSDFRLSALQVGSEDYQVDVVAKGGNQFEITSLHGRLINLGTLSPGGSFSYAYGISNNGLMTGRSRIEVQMGEGKKVRGPTSGVRFFNNGLIQDLGTLGGGRAQGRAINDKGTVAGYSSIKKENKDDLTVNHAFVSHYKNGYTQDIGTLGGNDSRAFGINDKGVVVGWSASLADNSDNVAFTYDIESETMAPLGAGLLGGKRSFAFDINDNDQIVGTATTDNGSAIAFLYENGTTTNLGSLDDSGYSEARAVNNNAQVTGWSLDGSKNYTAFIYDASGLKSLGGFGGDSKGYDINNHGDVVGSARDADDGHHAFLYRDGKMLDLYALLTPEDQELWKELREAYSISDKGVIVGRGRYWTDKENGKNGSRAFKLTVVR